MKINQIVHLSEGVAGPKNCWPGYKKTGTQPGTGKNKGKRVNDCEKIKQQGVAEGNDPNKLAASVTVDGELKEFDLTPFIVKNNWVGDPKTVIKQADKWLGDFLRSKGLAYSNLKISYKGMVMNASQTGDADVPMPEFESSELLGRYKKATKKQFANDEKGVAENKLPKPYKKWAS